MSNIFYQKDVVKFETCAECSSIAERDARIKELEQENYKLKEELRDEKDARASDHFAYLDMQKYAYRVGHNDECFKKDEEIARLKSMVQELKCCGNCKNDKFAGEDNCYGCSYPELLNWELSK